MIFRSTLIPSLGSGLLFVTLMSQTQIAFPVTSNPHLSHDVRENSPTEINKLQADIDGDGYPETIVFNFVDSIKVPVAERERCRQSLGKNKIPTISIFRSSSHEPIWVKHLCEGGSSFWSGTGVYDVGDRVPHLIVLLGVGPSFGAFLRIWRWQQDKMEWVNLPKGLSNGVAPLNITWTPDHIPTLLSLSITDSLSPPVLLAWERERYTDVSRRYPEYYRAHFQCEAKSLSTQVMPPDGWFNSATLCVEVLSLENRASDAANYCKEILTALDDPARTIPPGSLKTATGQRRQEIYEHFLSEKASYEQKVKELCERAESKRSTF